MANCKERVMDELIFHTAWKLSNGEINTMYKKLMKSGLDERSLGFWIYNVETSEEIYSPMFRANLQYEGLHDFPNEFSSWTKAIDQDQLQATIDSVALYLKTNGDEPFVKELRYNKKYKGHLDVICHANIITWDESGNPLLLVGVHVAP